jgi:hypothetical protein
MPIFSERHGDADDRDLNARAGQPQIQRQGDFRGHYGYGRPAHRTDPSASYGFETFSSKSKRSQ